MSEKCIEHRDGRLLALENLAIAKAEIRRLREIIAEVHSWAVCACIATPDDMAQNFPHIIDITTHNNWRDEYE